MLDMKFVRENPELVKEAVAEFGSRIAVGIDAKGGYVATEGWVEKSDVILPTLQRKWKISALKILSLPI